MAYFLRRVVYAVPILFGVNLLTFWLFFMVNTPDDLARMHLGLRQQKHVSSEAIQQWKISHGYDLPVFVNPRQTGVHELTDTLFVKKSLAMFELNFGAADDGRDIATEIHQRMVPSLMIAVPAFLLSLWVDLSLALLLVWFRNAWQDRLGVGLATLLMSISSLFFIIGGQFLLAREWRWMPVSGFDPGWDGWRFVLLPVMVSILAGIGRGTRWYRSVFLEEIGKDYVRTARSTGISEVRILVKHVLRNGMIPVLTTTVSVIPLLFMGSLLTESFFGIPGLGAYVVDALQEEDFAVVRSMVFIGSVLYVLGLMLTDIAYSAADPRVRLA